MTRDRCRQHPPARIRRKLLPVFFPLLLLALPALASSPEPLLRVLPNGMTVVLLENRTAPVVSIQAWVRTGSTGEKIGEYGMAHVLEHMLFKGTEKRGVG